MRLASSVAVRNRTLEVIGHTAIRTDSGIGIRSILEIQAVCQLDILSSAIIVFDREIIHRNSNLLRVFCRRDFRIVPCCEVQRIVGFHHWPEL